MCPHIRTTLNTSYEPPRLRAWAKLNKMPHRFESRTIEIQGEYVSCTTCAVNYNKEMHPLYCQEFNSPVNPRDIRENHDKAKHCKHYCPVGLPRWARVTPVKSGWEK